MFQGNITKRENKIRVAECINPGLDLKEEFENNG
jgi:hypothetical protein